uniref:Uncharacterized protein LOC114327023 n=1 Tax=Diabrotica virgifera virgifera TaxID=50390 RepID=A0A6P7F6E7_DIAVI
MHRLNRNHKNKINLEELSDAQLFDFIDSVEIDDSIYSSDDSIVDPDYVDNSIEPEKPYSLSKVSEAKSQVIDDCIQEMLEAETTDAFVNNINLPMDISNVDQPAASSTLVLDDVATKTSRN